MGTTVTPNLGLILPDSAESIKANLPTFAGWAVQNGINQDKVDALFRHDTNTWSPVWTTDTGTNPTLGSGGFIEGKFIRLFPRMVIGYLRIFCGGAGFAAGTGLYRISLPPATIPTEFTTLNSTMPIGKAHLNDNSTVATSTIFQVLYDVPNNVITFGRDEGDFWRNTSPITLAQNDRLSAFFCYPTSVP